MSEMSILRALNEVSLLNKKIDKQTSTSSLFTSFSAGGKVPVGFKNIEEVIKTIKSNWQSINDMISLREKIKVAIVAKNAITEVEICNMKYTVAGAIELKTSISHREQLLQKVKTNYAQTCMDIDRNNKTVEDNISNTIEKAFSGKSSKITKEEYDAIAVPIRKDKLAEIIDPLNIKNEIMKLEDFIDEFVRNIDNTLTESNAITRIEVPD